jgi:VanZ family protein
MNYTIYKIGCRSGLVAFAATIAYDIVQILQIYGVVRDPWSGILIFGFSLCISIPFLIEILVLRHATPDPRKFWSHAALAFTIMYAVFVIANYVVQLATVIPMSLKGKLDEVRILDQTPHSLFWDFDALGYIFMGIATFFAAFSFERKGFQKKVRAIFLANAFVTPLIAFVYFYPHFTDKLVLIGLPWAFTAPASMLSLAIFLKKMAARQTEVM